MSRSSITFTKAENALLARLEMGVLIYPAENRTTEGEPVSFATFGKLVAAGLVDYLAGYYLISPTGRLQAAENRLRKAAKA